MELSNRRVQWLRATYTSRGIQDLVGNLGLLGELYRAMPALFDAWDELQRLKEHRQSQIDLLEAELAAAHQIVNRVWAALGITTYAEARGKMIYEIVAELKAERLERADWRAQGEEASDDPT